MIVVEKIEPYAVSLKRADRPQHRMTARVDDPLLGIVTHKLELNFFEVNISRVGVLEEDRQVFVRPLHPHLCAP